MQQRYNAIIIGFGKGGKTLAAYLADQGQSVAIVERSDKMYGGTCINIACIPTKTLVYEAHKSLCRGERSFEEKAADYRRAIARKNEVTGFLRGKNYAMLADRDNVDVITGTASFVSPHEVEVKTADKTLLLSGERIFINTGGETVIPPIEGVRENPRVYTSTTMLELEDLPRRLIILGGGHVSQPVAEIGRLLGFHITVMDDRADFVTKERFPEADERITGDFETLSEKIPSYQNAYYVVVTRGHMGDSACARQILKRPFAYFGMIGSKTKVRITREKLLAEGFTQEQLDQIHAPIGLPIGGQMPAEIAVSIMAEIVQEKNRHFRTYCDEDVEAAIRCAVPGTMVTIIEKKGSSPRGTGSKMFVFRDGRTVGSIGGGKVEFEAGKYAVNVKEVETHIYELGQGIGELGMICGGTVRVLFEPVNPEQE